MHGTHDQSKPHGKCLSLEGKAYKKWWMAIKPHAKPTTLVGFESAFCKEFFLSNEKLWG